MTVGRSLGCGEAGGFAGTGGAAFPGMGGGCTLGRPPLGGGALGRLTLVGALGGALVRLAFAGTLGRAGGLLVLGGGDTLFPSTLFGLLGSAGAGATRVICVSSVSTSPLMGGSTSMITLSVLGRG